MVFRRRDKRPLMRIIADFFWPRGGWGRAFHYVKHRIRRLPDAPDRIARGIWAGVFASFTPFFGFHFVIAGLLGWIMRGNILAALMSTFFGNPVTFVLIATVSLRIGHWLLGTHFEEQDASLGGKVQRSGRAIFGLISPRSLPTGRLTGMGLRCFTTRCSCPIWWGGWCRV